MLRIGATLAVVPIPTMNGGWAAARRPPCGGSCLKKNTSLRTSAHTGVAIPSILLGLPMVDSARFRGLPRACGPRNDVFSFCAGSFCVLAQGRPQSQPVILSERSESKDLRTYRLRKSHSVRRSFDFGLRPSLRRTDFWCAVGTPLPGCPDRTDSPQSFRKSKDQPFGWSLVEISGTEPLPS